MFRRKCSLSILSLEIFPMIRFARYIVFAVQNIVIILVTGLVLESLADKCVYENYSIKQFCTLKFV